MAKKSSKSNKRANGDGTLRQRKDGTWEARYTVGINPGNGKPIRKSIYGKDKDVVAAKLRAATSSVDTGDYFDLSKLTVKQWFDTWLADYMAAVKPLTVQQYKSMADAHIIPAIGATKLSKLTAPQLQKFYNQLAVDGKTVTRKDSKTGKVEITKEPLSPKTIRNIHDIICKALNVAISQGIIRENVSSRTTLPKVIKKEVQPLSEEKQREFLKAIEGHKYRSLYLVYIFTGLRECEAIGLSWDCIDFKKGTMKVYRQWQRIPGKWSEFHYVPLKNDKTRIIKLSSFVLTVLRNQKTQQSLDKLAAGILWQGYQKPEEQDQYFIFSDKYGKPLNPAPVYEHFKKIATSIGIPSARVHDLRHTFAVNSLAEGDSPKTVQENLGHHSAAFTLDVYGHVSDRMREESAARQQAMIERMGIA